MHSLISRKNFPSICSTKWKRTVTSICSTLKLCGAPLIIRWRATCEKSASTLTIGKTTGANHTYMNTQPVNSAAFGTTSKKQRPTAMAVTLNTVVWIVTAGKRRSITPVTSKPICAIMPQSAGRNTVHTTTMRMKYAAHRMTCGYILVIVALRTD